MQDNITDPATVAAALSQEELAIASEFDSLFTSQLAGQQDAKQGPDAPADAPAQGNGNSNGQPSKGVDEPKGTREPDVDDNPQQLLELTRREREIDALRKEVASLKASKNIKEEPSPETFTKQELLEALLDGDTKIFEKIGIDPIDAFDRLTHVITGGSLKPEHVNTARIKKLEMRFDAEQRALLEATAKAEARRKEIEQKEELETLLDGYRAEAARLAADESTYELASAYDRAEVAQSVAQISLEHAKKNNGALLTPKQALDVLEKRLRAVYEPVSAKLSKKQSKQIHINGNKVSEGSVDDSAANQLSVHSLSKRTAENASKHITDAEVEAAVIREFDNWRRASLNGDD